MVRHRSPAIWRGSSLRNLCILLVPYLVLVFLHTLSGWRMEHPIILADELGYLGIARYLAGAAHLPDMLNAQFYHFGYSLFLVPAFWFLSEPASVYRAAIIINALLISSLFFPLQFILTSLFEVPRRIAVGIAFACCVYPPFILYSNFAWSENAFIPVFALTAALFGAYLRSRSTRDALLFSLSAGFLYTIHPRALPVLVLVVVYLLILAALKILPKSQVLLGATTMGLMFTATRVVNEHLKELGWGGVGEFSATRLVARIVPGSQWVDLAQRALGQVLYLSQASLCLFLAGLIGMVWFIYNCAILRSPRRAAAEPASGVSILLLISAAGIFLASSTSKMYAMWKPQGIRAAEFIYGRYNESFAILFLAFALMELWRRQIEGKQAPRQTLTVTALVLGLTWLVMLEVNAAKETFGAHLPWEVDGVSVAGIFPLLDLLGDLNLYLVSLVAIVSYWMITVLMRFSYRAGIALLVLVFSWCSLYNDRHYLQPTLEASRSRLSFLSEASRLGAIGAISFDTAYSAPGMLFGSQFWLQDTEFDRFDSRKGERPDSEVVISGKDWEQAEQLDAQLVLPEGTRDFALWVLPGQMRSRLESATYEGVTLGAQPVLGVSESGFYRQEWPDNLPARWTQGLATLKVLTEAHNPPQWLEIETTATGRDGARLQVLANGVELWNDRIPEVWSNTFSLDHVAPHEVMLIELKSETFVPDESTNRPKDDRSLGVRVRGIRLRTLDSLSPASFIGSQLGAEPVPGIQESGFYQPELIEGAPARWTTGAARMRIPLDPDHLPQVLEIETSAFGRDEARLQVLANGIELWNGQVPTDRWSTSFALEQVPLRDLLILELNSDPFTPHERVVGAADRRDLGVIVRGIRLRRLDDSEKANDLW